MKTFAYTIQRYTYYIVTLEAFVMSLFKRVHEQFSGKKVYIYKMTCFICMLLLTVQFWLKQICPYMAT